MAGNDRTSPVFDEGLAYDLLPSLTRWAISSPIVSLYPRFLHANVELRTAYLDQAMEQVMSEQPPKVRLVLLGGGYDLRLIRMAHKYGPDVVTELIHVDLPQVIAAQQKNLRERLLKRRPALKHIIENVKMIPVDLNELEQVRQLLTEAISTSSTSSDCLTVFVLEAVLIYLDEGVPRQLLALLSQTVHATPSGKGALLFADTLPLSDVSGDHNVAHSELESLGWTLNDWSLKPGRTRHLGWAAATRTL